MGEDSHCSPFYFSTIMDYTLQQIKQTLLKDVFEVYDIFKNHFGEQFVDLQKLPSDADILYYFSHSSVSKDIVQKEDDVFSIPDAAITALKDYIDYPVIYVWWPQVIITNENGKSISIQDLYAKIVITLAGCIPYEQCGFKLNRTTYPASQFDSGYMHSHISSIPKDNFEVFQKPCLGTGPILRTITTLKSNNDTAMWMLFCEELSRYVTVESLKGIPYNHLENIGARHRHPYFRDFVFSGDFLYNLVTSYNRTMHCKYQTGLNNIKSLAKSFLPYYLHHGHLSFSFRQGKFSCGLSYYNYIIDVSNCFIDYFNSTMAVDENYKNKLYRAGLFNTVKVANNDFFQVDNDNSNISYNKYRGKQVLTFKGEPKTLEILEDNNGSVMQSTLIDNSLAMYILNSILNIINFRFKNEYHSTHTSSTSTETRKTVTFL